ncbi:Glutamyl-tRNA(Gln) amidotransferase subunit C [compost metagenome]
MSQPPAQPAPPASEHPNHHAMALALSDVKRIAHLARIETSDDEAAQTLAQLNNFFSLVEQMQAVDTTGIEPLAHPLSAVRDMVQRLRDDAVTESDRRDDYQRPAPATENGLYLVPKVIE